MAFNNEVCDEARDTVSTYTLNRWFKFAAIGDEATMREAHGSSPIHVICICPNLSAFSAMFLYLLLEQLAVIAFAHHIPLVLNKPALLHATIRHICSRHYPGLFSRMQTLKPIFDPVDITRKKFLGETEMAKHLQVLDDEMTVVNEEYTQAVARSTRKLEDSMMRFNVDNAEHSGLRVRTTDTGRRTQNISAAETAADMSDFTLSLAQGLTHSVRIKPIKRVVE
ncbi:hypothetical protein B0H14DRAFT_2649440 [Mycena olivaceomarginata]|nr:hypothetical protein B0H14DRAFT_2649440 [Mycena olivaceomarginata]